MFAFEGDLDNFRPTESVYFYGILKHNESCRRKNKQNIYFNWDIKRSDTGFFRKINFFCQINRPIFWGVRNRGIGAVTHWKIFLWKIIHMYVYRSCFPPMIFQKRVTKKNFFFSWPLFEKIVCGKQLLYICVWFSTKKFFNVSRHLFPYSRPLKKLVC